MIVQTSFFFRTHNIRSNGMVVHFRLISVVQIRSCSSEKKTLIYTRQSWLLNSDRSVGLCIRKRLLLFISFFFFFYPSDGLTKRKTKNKNRYRIRRVLYGFRKKMSTRRDGAAASCSRRPCYDIIVCSLSLVNVITSFGHHGARDVVTSKTRCPIAKWCILYCKPVRTI